MSNPSLPPVPTAVSSSSPLRRRTRDPDDDVEDDALEEGELRVPDPVGHESSDNEDHDDDATEVVRSPQQQQHRSPPSRLGSPLSSLEILLLGACAGGALPSPTPAGECESDATLSDDHHHGRGGGGNSTGSGSGSGSSAGLSSSSAAIAADADAVDRGWAATGKRGWKAGDRHRRHQHVAFSDSDSDSDLNTISADGQGQQVGTTSSSSAQAAHHHQQPSLPPQQAAQPPRAPIAAHGHHHQESPLPLPQQAAQPQPQPQPQPPRAPRPRRERATEYTCKECGKSYTTNQALGGHAAGHKNKQREAAAAMAAGEGGASLAAAFPFPLRRGDGKADEPHECRKCGKVFASGVALGGHMRVHYTGPPIVPARKNKKRCLAPPPTPTPAEGDVAAAPPVGLSLALSIKTEQDQPPSTPPAVLAGGAVRAVRLFGIDISPQAQQAPLEQQQGSGDTTEDSSSTGQH